MKVYLASAKPIAEAEAERRSRSKAGTDPVAEEYRLWSAENRGKYIVLAIPVNDPQAMAMAEEGRGIEKSVMVLGKKKVPLAMHFPPSSTDPYLRLVFPKMAAEKKIRFEIFVPGAIAPEREVEFDVTKLKYLGKPEY